MVKDQNAGIKGWPLVRVQPGRLLLYMNPNKQPNPKIHLYLSLSKSLLRIVAGWALVSQLFGISGCTFVLAEMLGILEELF